MAKSKASKKGTISTHDFIGLPDETRFPDNKKCIAEFSQYWKDCAKLTKATRINLKMMKKARNLEIAQKNSAQAKAKAAEGGGSSSPPIKKMTRNQRRKAAIRSRKQSANPPNHGGSSGSQAERKLFERPAIAHRRVQGWGTNHPVSPPEWLGSWKSKQFEDKGLQIKAEPSERAKDKQPQPFHAAVVKKEPRNEGFVAATAVKNEPRIDPSFAAKADLMVKRITSCSDSKLCRLILNQDDLDVARFLSRSLNNAIESFESASSSLADLPALQQPGLRDPPQSSLFCRSDGPPGINKPICSKGSPIWDNKVEVDTFSLSRYMGQPTTMASSGGGSLLSGHPGDLGSRNPLFCSRYS